ncbi:MAG: DUF2141 domain-containing protein [Brevundimonas sp.]|nr:MAG: DUF2141 domain-containing protein [Brevundimonas sp.]
MVVPVIPMTRAIAPPHEAVEAMAIRASRRFTADLLSKSQNRRLGDVTPSVNPKGEKLRANAADKPREARHDPQSSRRPDRHKQFDTEDFASQSTSHEAGLARFRRTIMKNAIVAAVAALSCLAAAPAFAGDVTVTLTGVQARGGQLLAALQTRDQFLQPAGAYGEIVRNPSAGTVTVTFRGVEPGEYSLSVLHDADGDGQMKLEGGMPAEGWAMVNGAALRAAPTWDQVKFSAPASGDSHLTVPMQYFR